MRVCVPLIFTLVLIAHSFGQQQSGQATPNPPTSTIPAGEANFTAEQLKEYYLVYRNPDVRYLRKLFDKYLAGGAGVDDEFNLLKEWSSDYYRSKFVVLSREGGLFGGTFITIIFQDRPDKIFVAWIYPEGSNGKLTLRKLDASRFNDEDVRRTRTRYRKFLEDKEHAM